MALTVAVTGPTGDIGISAVEALEHAPEVERIIGMARRPFDPAAHGWTRTEYLQGDILDRDAVDALVADADVVVHLAFIIMGSREESARVNLEGTPTECCQYLTWPRHLAPGRSGFPGQRRRPRRRSSRACRLYRRRWSGCMWAARRW
jgi:hypothetical protein